MNFLLVYLLPGKLLGRWSIGVYLGLLLSMAYLGVQRAESSSDAETNRAGRVSGKVGVLGILLAIVAAGVVGSALWIHALPNLSQAPPNFDGAQHGFLTARIVATGSARSSTIALTGPAGLSASAGYYPLGLHTTAAMVVILGGIGVAMTLNIAVILFTAWILPVGAVAFLRELVPNRVIVAAAGAISVVAVQPFPYKPIGWGGIPLIAGMSMALGVAALLITVVRRRSRRFAAFAYAGGASAGLFYTHNTEFVLAGVLGVAVVLFDEVGSVAVLKERFRDALQGLWRVAAVMVVLVLPVLPELVRGGAERVSFDDTPLAEPLFALGQLIFLDVGGVRQGLLVIYAIVGMAILLRANRPVLPGMALVLGLVAFWTATTDNPVSAALSFPWWRQFERVVYVEALLAGLASAVAIGTLIEFLWGARRLVTRGIGVLAVVGVTVVSLWLPGIHAGHTIVFRSYRFYSPLSASSLKGFEVAAEHAGDGGTVVTEWNRDASLWVYAYTGAYSLFGIGVPDNSVDKTREDRIAILDGIVRAGVDPLEDELLRKYRVGSVYFDEHTYYGSDHSLTREDLMNAPGLREVFHEGSVSVFAVDISP